MLGPHQSEWDEMTEEHGVLVSREAQTRRLITDYHSTAYYAKAHRLKVGWVTVVMERGRWVYSEGGERATETPRERTAEVE